MYTIAFNVFSDFSKNFNTLRKNRNFKSFKNILNFEYEIAKIILP